MRWPLHLDHTWEMTPPYRFSRSLVVRIWPLPVGLVFGWWRDSDVQSKTEAFVASEEAANEQLAFDAYVVVNGPVDRERWQEARREIAGENLDPEEEMARMQEAGVFGGQE